jgi:hypothetical protein
MSRDEALSVLLGTKKPEKKGKFGMNPDEYRRKHSYGGGGISLISYENGTRGIATVGLLKGLDSTTLKDKDTRVVMGYHTPGDEGGGEFFWKAGDLTPDNGGTVLQSAGGGSGRWFRIYSGAVNVRWFGAKGDGTTDDTTAIHAAIDSIKAASGTSGKVFFPRGNFRVTSGYTNTSSRFDIVFEGEACSRKNENSRGSQVTLDNASSASFFYDSGTVNQLLNVRNMMFKCAQSVPGRDFFIFRSTDYVVFFDYVDFESVERPFVFKAGSYFQSASFTNIQFQVFSGTFHSETSSLVGTLMVINNVHHEHGCPNNTTEKVVCDLRGIRTIQATNFLLEGALPSSGWTVLKLNGAGGTWERDCAFEASGYHSEWTVNAPAYALDVENCRASFSQCQMGAGAAYPMKLTNSALTLTGASFTGDDTKIADYFVFDDIASRVILRDCSVRAFSGPGAAQSRITFENCGWAANGGAGAESATSTIFSNTQSTLMWRWNGGFSDPKVGTLSAPGSTSIIPSLDASYGRKLVVTPNGQVASFTATTQARGFIKQKDMFWITGHLTFPTFTSGTFLLYFIQAGVTGSVAGFSTDYSGQTLRFAYPVRITEVLTDTSTVGLHFNLLSGAGVSGTFDIHSVGFYSGNAAPPGEFPAYPATIITYNSAAPTVGEWAQGDIVYNNAPAASGTIGWVCTTAGTPGTWKTFGTIAA